MSDSLARILATGFIALLVSAGIVMLVAGLLSMGSLITNEPEDE